MSTLRVQGTEATTSDSQFFTSNWYAQTFTPSASFDVTSAKIKVFREGTVTTCTMSIRATDGNGQPTGADLTSGSADASGVTTSSAGEYFEVAFNSAITLTGGIVYALIIRITGGDASNNLHVRIDTSAGYSGGAKDFSNDSGSSWTGLSNDLNFQIWGDAPTLLNLTYSKSLVAISNSEVWYESSAGTMEELTDANGDIDTAQPLQAFEGYEKVLIANGTKLKIADFGSIKLATANVGSHPPDFGTVLTGGTSGSILVVDYITALSGATTIYGNRTTVATFSSGETVTGTDDDGNAVSFVISANEVAAPHWRDWTVYGGSTDYGVMPSNANIACLYRGRAVLSGNPNYPFQWYMSRQNNIYDWQYVANDQQSPVASGNSDAGEIGSVITALIPYKDDYLIFGSANALYYLIGDPMAGGSINELSLTDGILGKRAWCWDANGNLYIMSTSGLLKISPGFANLENLTEQSYPKFITELAFNPLTDRITLAYDRTRFGITICKTVVATGVNTNYWYDLRTSGIFPESYPVEAAALTAFQYDATDPTYQKLLYGCADGYIRLFDDAAKDDDVGASDDAIDSYVTFGPIHVTSQEDGEGLIGPVIPVLAGGASGSGQSDSSNVAFKIFVGPDSEAVVEAMIANGTARISGTYTAPGRRRGGQDVRKVRGSWAGIRIGNSTAEQQWALESLKVTLTPAGRVL